MFAVEIYQAGFESAGIVWMGGRPFVPLPMMAKLFVHCLCCLLTVDAERYFFQVDELLDMEKDRMYLGCDGAPLQGQVGLFELTDLLTKVIFEVHSKT